VPNYKALVEFRINGEAIYKDEVFDGSRLDGLLPSQLDYLKNGGGNGLRVPRIEETTDAIFRPDDPTPPPPIVPPGSSAAGEVKEVDEAGNDLGTAGDVRVVKPTNGDPAYLEYETSDGVIERV